MEFYEMSGKVLRANCSGARFLHSYLTPSKPARKAKFFSASVKNIRTKKKILPVRPSVTYFITIIVTLDAVLLSYRKPKLPNE